ncbi:hypothetical protein MP638_000720 [Amoeboaphelidium occidentale]|nr:hypothetical protein MP638_000720 [Amoeboaphelidium occidentale]
MKIIDKINTAINEDRCGWSFEYFPPKTAQGVQNLFDRLERMYTLGPEFIDVTWGAGGTTSELTMEICSTAQNVYGLETCMHLTCTNMPKEKIDLALKEAKDAGIQNILALRGDPPRGQTEWVQCDSGFSNAVDLVKYIRAEYGDYFCVSVAGYPEGHLDNPDKEADLLFLKEKVDAGADYIVTQLFYDTELYLRWVEKCRSIGINVPILPGIMPIQSYGGFKRMTTLCKTYVPPEIWKALEPIKDDDQAVKDYGVQLAIAMCNKLKAHGTRCFHFYTLNLEKSVRLILEGLQFVADIEVAKPLPWQPSLAKNRTKENVRPIFWKNRTRTYVMRTEAWDEFPNGRWGDSRSPAYGELDGYGISLKYTPAEALELWDTPKTTEEVCEIFSKYCKGEIRALPWCDQPLSAETDCIKDQLIKLNKQGFLTVNSQPAVNGLPSKDTTFGWGPKNGYVYQKAYLEFFVHPKAMNDLINSLKNYPSFTYYAVDKQGTLLTNVSGEIETVNAVTWGVFPGKEILQPTIVEKNSFLAWKNEAFQIWNEWALLYEKDSEPAKLLEGIADSYYLVNIVDNDFVKGDIFKVFGDLIEQ